MGDLGGRKVDPLKLEARGTGICTPRRLVYSKLHIVSEIVSRSFLPILKVTTEHNLHPVSGFDEIRSLKRISNGDRLESTIFSEINNFLASPICFPTKAASNNSSLLVDHFPNVATKFLILLPV